MAFKHEFAGYVKVPTRPLYNATIRLEFNPQIGANPQEAKLEGFALYMFHLPKRIGSQETEIGITMTAEQWLDLIDDMKLAFEESQKIRKDFEPDPE
jgi:hypothetical protein